MPLDMMQALARLSACRAPSGFEGEAARTAAELLAPLVDQVSIDRAGNVVGVRRCGRPGARRLLLDAHLDEIGLIVTGVEEGFLRFRSIGGVDPRMLPDREVVVCTPDPLPGVIACLPPHVLSREDAQKSVPIKDLFIDVGMTQAQAARRIPVGTPVVFRADCFALGNGQACGKSLDDRACFVTLLRAAELLWDAPLDVDLYILGSTREETNGAGAKTAAFALKPDWCVAVDVTHGATPDAPKAKTFPLGSGPAIGVGPSMSRWMTRRLLDRAKALDMSFRQEVMTGHTGTNGWYFQISREGVPTAVLSLPLKYMHSPIEAVSLADMEQVARLLCVFVQGLGEEAAPCC